MRVLVPIDGSDPADAALDHALEHFSDSTIIAVHVMDPVDGATAWGPSAAENWMNAAEERSEQVLSKAKELADQKNSEIETDSVVGRPAHAIIEYTDDNDIDHVVVGSHGRDGVARVLLGSVAETVVRRASVPVTVVRPPT